jgi:hypothetical protein
MLQAKGGEEGNEEEENVQSYVTTTIEVKHDAKRTNM